MKSLTNYENPSSIPFQKACFDFPIAARDTETCSKSRPWRMAYAGENCQNERQGEPDTEILCGFRRSL